METYVAELHIHTVLSPCAEGEMIPPLIVREALERDTRLIAITDHNASANVRAVQKAAARTGLVVLPGMEVQTREEVHVLCLFESCFRGCAAFRSFKAAMRIAWTSYSAPIRAMSKSRRLPS